MSEPAAPPLRVFTPLRVAALVLAALLLAALGVLSLLGMRTDVGVLSGTRPSRSGDAVLGIAYAATWFGAVVAAPSLVLFVAIDALLEALPRIGAWISSRRR
ncbi:MAG: hypothetical protein U0414_24015 [Polyangiaceae bacterium]